MARPEIDLDDDLIERVESYAKTNGLMRRRAYADLIEAGLDNVEEDDRR